MSIRIWVDLGGTKIEIIALDAEGHTLIRERRPTPNTDYEVIIRLTVDLINNVEKRIGARGTIVEYLRSVYQGA